MKLPEGVSPWNLAITGSPLIRHRRHPGVGPASIGVMSSTVSGCGIGLPEIVFGGAAIAATDAADAAMIAAETIAVFMLILRFVTKRVRGYVHIRRSIVGEWANSEKLKLCYCKRDDMPIKSANQR